MPADTVFFITSSHAVFHLKVSPLMKDLVEYLLVEEQWLLGTLNLYCLSTTIGGASLFKPQIKITGNPAMQSWVW